MDDTTAQNQSNSYVNTYVPPSDMGAPVSQFPSATAVGASGSTTGLQSSNPASVAEAHKNPDTSAWLASTPGSMAIPPRPVSAPMPAALPSRPTTLPEYPPQRSPLPEVSNDQAPAAKAASTSQSLEDQNIFELLGVAQASDEEKEAFLDELQQVIWEDFIENDVQLLLTEAEMSELQKIQTQSFENDLEKQEAMVVYLEKLIPDLEDIMLEKAMELKRDMVMERISGMKEYFADKADKLQEITRAESLIAQNQWRAGADALNKTAQT